MGIYELSIKRPFTDFKKLGIGLLFNILPILNFFAVGYALRCSQLSMKNNFEMPSQPETLTPEEVDELYEKTVASFEKTEIKPENFIDIYGEDPVRQDLQYVKKMEEKFAKEQTPEQKKIKKRATIFEGIIHDNAELSNWLGPDVVTIKTSGLK